MSQENVETVRRAFDAINRRMIEEALEFMDPEGELHSAIMPFDGKESGVSLTV